MSFASLGLNDQILIAVSEQGYDKPSPIQEKAIPAVLKGKDVMAAAQTGTGKTAGFTLPILQKLSHGHRVKPNKARALILTPTRELAAQVGDSVATYGKHLSLRSTVVFGGVKINPQMMRLRGGVDILVATPGRLLDLYNQKAVKFDQLEVLVLDEADRMLDMGFIHDIRKILAVLPKKRQNLMFSATFSKDIRALAKTIVNDPVEVSVTPPNATANTVEQWVYPVDKKQKAGLLTQLIKENDWQQVLVFTRTKHGANRLTKQLDSKGISAAAIHGNKSQGARTRALADFKQGKVRILVATDIAARGLDIDQLPQVVNFDLPNVPEDYVHRIGRTGRAGANGHAVSLVSADEIKQLNDIERLINKELPRQLIDGFKPILDVPPSSFGKPGARPKKPKKPKQKPEANGNVKSEGNTRRSKPSRRPPKSGDNQSSSRRRSDSNGNVWPAKKSEGSGNRRSQSRPSGNRRNTGNQKTQQRSGNQNRRSQHG